MSWNNRINLDIDAIDAWFGKYGDLIPEEPRQELIGHLRDLTRIVVAMNPPEISAITPRSLAS